MGMYCHMHIAPYSTWLHVDHVKKNHTPTPQQTIKQGLNQKTNKTTNKHMASHKPFHPHKDTKQTKPENTNKPLILPINRGDIEEKSRVRAASGKLKFVASIVWLDMQKRNKGYMGIRFFQDLRGDCSLEATLHSYRWYG